MASPVFASVGWLVPMSPLAPEGMIQLQPLAGTPQGFLGTTPPVTRWVTTLNPGSPRLKLGTCATALEHGPGPPGRLLPCPVPHWFLLGLTGLGTSGGTEVSGSQRSKCSVLPGSGLSPGDLTSGWLCSSSGDVTAEETML